MSAHAHLCLWNFANVSWNFGPWNVSSFHETFNASMKRFMDLHPYQQMQERRTYSSKWLRVRQRKFTRIGNFVYLCFIHLTYMSLSFASACRRPTGRRYKCTIRPWTPCINQTTWINYILLVHVICLLWFCGIFWV